MAAAKPKKKSRQSLMSKAMNAGLIVLGFSRPLQHLWAFVSGRSDALESLQYEATFGLSGGTLDLAAGGRMYAPAGSAAALGYLKSYLLRKFPVRR